jgi:hypothetical protein
MSETSAAESPPKTELYDEAGRPLRSGQSQQTAEELIGFAKEHPVGTALGALALGYFLGKFC